ncbi:MAG: hypothetical protein QXM68_01730 [Candidatus Aenigmatarchaeota archaeon]|nr:hypothetical protein [Candidatus Aenigmarchaeota archaeon]
MVFGSKGADWISIFFLLTIVFATLVVTAVAIPGFIDFVLEYITNVITSIMLIAIGSFLILFGIIIAGSHLRTGKTLSYIGLGVIIVGFLIIQMSYVMKSRAALATPMTVKCSTGGANNIAEGIMCVITGYKYKGNYGGFAFLSYWVFGVVVPLLLLMSLFYDFVSSSGVIKRPQSQKIVGYCLGLIAYRGFVVTNLLEILSIGTLGIALVALDLIFLGGLLAYINRVFEKWRPIEHAMGIARGSMQAKFLMKNYARDVKIMIKNGDFDHALDILDTMEHYAQNLQWKNLIIEAKNNLQTNPQVAEEKINQLIQLLR